ncbi:hypothetical protein Pmani_005054 [Petrolisthes manimaculis]|uniref:Uncharacterized protein n=1 Tax=Petrolisthes manimaculis TaxID=1843537 RepID=A0AAE1QFF9_9EUCA|nr:hypothetical protein Pmani_005054 [Petrolisthes manimaculis]
MDAFTRFTRCSVQFGSKDGMSRGDDQEECCVYCIANTPTPQTSTQSPEKENKDNTSFIISHIFNKNKDAETAKEAISALQQSINMATQPFIKLALLVMVCLLTYCCHTTSATEA